MDILKCDEKMRTILYSEKFIPSRRQQAHVKNVLTSKITASTVEGGGSKKIQGHMMWYMQLHYKNPTQVWIKSTG